MKKIFIILSVLVLVSCSKSLDIQLEPEVTVYLSDDSKQEIRLTSKDKEYTNLNEWLREHSSGWHTTSGRYPGGVYVKSGIYGIQITKAYVVLYSTTSPGSRAIYIQNLGKGKLSGIRNIGK